LILSNMSLQCRATDLAFSGASLVWRMVLVGNLCRLRKPVLGQGAKAQVIHAHDRRTRLAPWKMIRRSPFSGASFVWRMVLVGNLCLLRKPVLGQGAKAQVIYAHVRRTRLAPWKMIRRSPFSGASFVWRVVLVGNLCLLRKPILG
jgi:hypothetical protein